MGGGVFWGGRGFPTALGRIDVGACYHVVLGLGGGACGGEAVGFGGGELELYTACMGRNIMR